MTKDLLEHVAQILTARLNFDHNFKVQFSNRSDLSELQSSCAFTLAKKFKRAPKDIADEIVLSLKNEAIFSQIFNENGFINISLDAQFLAIWVNDLNKAGFIPQVTKKRKVIMDFGGPNIAKPMHVGHLRSSLIGSALYNIYRAMGDEVISDIHLGDFGLQMGLLIEEIRIMDPTLIYFSHDFAGENVPFITVQELSEIYPRAAKRGENDAAFLQKAKEATLKLQQGEKSYVAIWQQFIAVSLPVLRADFALLGVNFDLWLGESDVKDLIPALIAKLTAQQIVQESEGAIIIELPNMPPFILLKSDGAYLYSTTDLATIAKRTEEYQADLILYVVDKRQSLHFQQLFMAAEKCGFAVALKHVGFGTINGLDGKPFKTRAGGVLHLGEFIKMVIAQTIVKNEVENKEEVINKIALAAIKFADLSNVYYADYIFDINRFCKYEGKTGPYILYSAVRIKSILHKLAIKLTDIKIKKAENKIEKNLHLQLAKLPLVLTHVYETAEVHRLAEYVYELAVLFNNFYATYNIINEVARKDDWINLIALVLKHLEICSDLLGISIPDRM